METFLYIYVFIVGLILGSFYNVVGLRVPLKQSIVRPRSACPHCGHQLSARELIPVFSFLLQKGKCRSCRARISPLYPIVEWITGCLFLLAPLTFGWTEELLIVWTFESLLVIIFVSDIKYMLIPDQVLLFFAALFLLERVLIPLEPWWDSLVGSLGGFILLFVIAVISKGGMGGGDIKLFALLGFVLGIKLVLVSFLLSTLFGALYGVIAIITKKVKRKQAIPFGPFIALGALTAYFYGEIMIDNYIEFLIR
ncbi:prepilin peptidase [Bacillaceae bacterium Marseille-Q3522]|nr:prepilin peptidase [Bacillaceae bacterium Marseille-Q3522]